jgi:hypothetical protein
MGGEQEKKVKKDEREAIVVPIEEVSASSKGVQFWTHRV